MKQPGRLATAALSAAVLLAACSGLEPKDFSAVAPAFEPDRFFDGPIHAWGVQENGGLPTRSFTAELSSSREGDTLSITETYSFSDGKSGQRSWKLRRLDKHHYQASGSDLEGTVAGQVYGNALLLDGTMSGGLFGSGHLRQWFYLQKDGGTVLGRMTLSGFMGFKSGEVAEVLRRETPASQ